MAQCRGREVQQGWLILEKAIWQGIDDRVAFRLVMTEEGEALMVSSV